MAWYGADYEPVLTRLQTDLGVNGGTERIEKILLVNGEEVRVQAFASHSEAVSDAIWMNFFKDISRLQAAARRRAAFAFENLEIFENVPCLLALHADPTVPGNIEDRIDQFGGLSQILELWGRT